MATSINHSVRIQQTCKKTYGENCIQAELRFKQLYIPYFCFNCFFKQNQFGLSLIGMKLPQPISRPKTFFISSNRHFPIPSARNYPCKFILMLRRCCNFTIQKENNVCRREIPYFFFSLFNSFSNAGVINSFIFQLCLCSTLFLW